MKLLDDGSVLTTSKTVISQAMSDGIERIAGTKDMRGYSDGHEFAIIGIPTSWTHEQCADPDDVGCTEAVVSSCIVGV